MCLSAYLDPRQFDAWVREQADAAGSRQMQIHQMWIDVNIRQDEWWRQQPEGQAQIRETGVKKFPPIRPGLQPYTNFGKKAEDIAPPEYHLA